MVDAVAIDVPETTATSGAAAATSNCIVETCNDDK